MTAKGQLVAERYRVIRALAAGGLGRVWLAADEMAAGRRVALKQSLVPDGLSEAEQAVVRERAVAEARAVSRIVHPNVIRILDVLPDDDGPWIVMEHVPSRSLLEVIEQSGRLPADRVARIGLAVLEALGAAARAGLVHLDLKPGNVLICPDGRVVLNDFGPAVTAEAVAAFTAAGIILGSPKYIAPERLFDGVSGVEADLWSLGATLYHAVEGRPPYQRKSIEETLRALAADPPDRPEHAGPLGPVLDGLLKRDPAQRLTAAGTQDALRRVILPSTPPPVEAQPRAEAEPPVEVEPPADAEPPAEELAEPAEQPAERAEPAAEDEPAAAEPAGARRSRPRRIAAIALVAAVIAAVAAIAAGAQGTGRRPPRGNPVAPSTSSAPPAGFEWWNDPAGFRVAVPIGWQRSPGPVFTAPGGRPSLRITAWAPPPPDPLAALTAQERSVPLPGYRRIRIEPLPNRPGALWEYTFTGPLRAEQQVLTVAGHTYRVEWQAPRDDWAAGLAEMDTIMDSFGPAPGA
jgi:hypothetical protein